MNYSDRFIFSILYIFYLNTFVYLSKKYIDTKQSNKKNNQNSKDNIITWN